MVKLGDKLWGRVEYGMSGGSMLPMELGTVVYVHPEGRFFTLEFRFEKGAFRQSYPIKGRITVLSHDNQRPEYSRRGG